MAPCFNRSILSVTGGSMLTVQLPNSFTFLMNSLVLNLVKMLQERSKLEKLRVLKLKGLLKMAYWVLLLPNMQLMHLHLISTRASKHQNTCQHMKEHLHFMKHVKQLLLHLSVDLALLLFTFLLAMEVWHSTCLLVIMPAERPGEIIRESSKYNIVKSVNIYLLFLCINIC